MEGIRDKREVEQDQGGTGMGGGSVKKKRRKGKRPQDTGHVMCGRLK